MSTKLMHGKGKTPRGRVNLAAKRFDLACVAQTIKRNIERQKNSLLRRPESVADLVVETLSLLDFFISRREQSKR
jgi:hypothetical protein